jgi:hypothetical protein
MIIVKLRRDAHAQAAHRKAVSGFTGQMPR